MHSVFGVVQSNRDVQSNCVVEHSIRGVVQSNRYV